MSAEAIYNQLNISDDESLTIFNPPENEDKSLDGITGDISISEGDPADVVLAFCENQKQLIRNLLNLKSNIKRNGSLWILWQDGNSKGAVNRGLVVDYAQNKNLKKASETDINQNWKAIQLKLDYP